MHGLDLVNTAIFVGSALILIGIFSSLVATRFGAPLLLVFLVVGMLAGEDGPGGIEFGDYSTTYMVGMIALSVILFDGGLRTRLSVFRGVLRPSLLLATVGVLITAGVVGLAVWQVLGLSLSLALLLGAIVASTDAAAVFFLIRTGGMRLPGRVNGILEIESGTNDPISVFFVILLVKVIVSGGMPGWELVEEFAAEAVLGGALGFVGGWGAVSILNRVAMPGGLHPLFVVAGAIMISGFTTLVGGSGLLAVYIAGLVMANRPTRAYPSIVGFHDAMTWLCQIVMFLVLGLLVTPSRVMDYAPQGMFVAVVLTLIARPVAVWVCLWGAGFATREKLFISWVGLRGAVSIFLAAIPMLAGVPESQAFFNIAFFVVLFSMLVQGATLTSAGRWLGVALKATTRGVSRIEIDIPGQNELEIVGYPVTGESVILGLSRIPAWARLLMVVRKGQILDQAEAGGLRPGDYGYFLVPRERLNRFDTLFRESPEVARRLGVIFGELAIRGETRLSELEQFYDLSFEGHPPEMTLAEWATQRLGEKPVLDATLAIPGGKIVVRRLESGRIANLGLQLDQLLQVEPDERLLARLEEEADELRGLRSWARSVRRRLQT
ncbi:cell volume regulation protein A [Amaricoccus macauensis]|uniref:Cell volume regulation protein A n=1 Tax=Amaricoccus macauensis TaxID=57001 RepID=A0A840SPB9_9RHOB|nr:potassium/proton antiporter [Amaricoccus macauensis]MBB5221141.1 cell volume regulation protein A [Amaricoccus macauensis]